MLPETWSKQENARIQKALISDSLMPLNLVRTIDWRVPGQPGVHWQRQDLKALICAYDRFSTVFLINCLVLKLDFIFDWRHQPLFLPDSCSAKQSMQCVARMLVCAAHRIKSSNFISWPSCIAAQRTSTNSALRQAAPCNNAFRIIAFRNHIAPLDWASPSCELKDWHLVQNLY